MNHYKATFLHKLAQCTRKRKWYQLDFLLRQLHNPDKRQKDALETILKLENNTFFHINTASYLEWYLFFYGYYEPFIAHLMQSLVKPGDTCIDIGANIGIHSINLAQLVGQHGTVYAFEPHPYIFNKFMQNVRLNRLHWLKTFEMGISDVSTNTNLYGFSDGASNQGTSSLQNNHAHTTTPIFAIKTITLDQFVEEKRPTSISLIKIDVEGHEKHVFLGAQKTIAAMRPTIIFENNKEAPAVTQYCAKHLNNLSYTLYGIGFNTLTQITNGKLPNNASNILAIP